MSRSHGQKSCGRGCWVCGDAGEARRAREEDARRADEREQDSLAPVAEQDSLAPVAEQDSRAPVPEQDSLRGKGWGSW